MDPLAFQCFCGEKFDLREDLVDHNVQLHGMNESESRRAVDGKYPLDEAV